MALITMEKGQMRDEVSGRGKKWRTGGWVWREACSDAAVLYSEDLETEPWQKESPDQNSILKPRIKLWEALVPLLRGFEIHEPVGVLDLGESPCVESVRERETIMHNVMRLFQY